MKSLTIEYIEECAAKCQEFEARGLRLGDDLSPPHRRLIRHMARVGRGELLPEVILAFGNAGLPSLINVVGGLPVDLQRRVIDQPKLVVVVSVDAASGQVRQERRPSLR